MTKKNSTKNRDKLKENIVLEINNLHKTYGNIHAVNDLSLQVEKGSVYGILGPNGSGKSTTIGIILGTINKTAGDFTWFGEKDKLKVRKKIGAIIESPTFYPYMSAKNNLKVIADIKGVPHSELDEILEFVGLKEREDYAFKTFSLGMKQRLAIAAAMVGKPEVMILDEPTNGLDPKGIHSIRELILKIAEQGVTILLASHLLDEVQKTCSHVAILNKGKILSSGKVQNILSTLPIIEVACQNMESLKEKLEEIPQIKSIQATENFYEIRVDEGYTALQLSETLAKAQLYVSHLKEQKQSLESYFLDLVNQQS